MKKAKQAPRVDPEDVNIVPDSSAQPVTTAEPTSTDAELLDRILTEQEEHQLMQKSRKRDIMRYVSSSFDLTDKEQRRFVVNCLNLPSKSLKDIKGQTVLVDGWIIEAKMIADPETGELRPGRALTLTHKGLPVCSFASEISIEQFLTIRDSLDSDWPKPWVIYVHAVLNPKSGHDWYPLELLQPEEDKQ